MSFSIFSSFCLSQFSLFQLIFFILFLYFQSRTPLVKILKAEGIPVYRRKQKKKKKKSKNVFERDFCMEKLLAREVTIFPEKIKVSIFCLKFIKPTPTCNKSLPGVQTFEFSRQICQNPKLNSFGLSPLSTQNPYSKTFLDTEFWFVNQFSIFRDKF